MEGSNVHYQTSNFHHCKYAVWLPIRFCDQVFFVHTIQREKDQWQTHSVNTCLCLPQKDLADQEDQKNGK